ncbi:MAG: type III PLP-dependent enzyme, partial [Pseudomonadota bacterium]
RAARWFVNRFPGDVLYAAKANPHPAVLDAVWSGGVRIFDVASLAEIERVRAQFPTARLNFMHTVKARSAIRAAYLDHGVRNFAVDCEAELQKIIEETDGAQDLNLLVRLAVSDIYASHKLSGKFGASGAEAVFLLRHARAVADELGVSFHVGSQCMRPEAYRVAMTDVGETIRRAGVTIDIVDVGGGFPAAYPSLTPPPLEDYIRVIEDAFEEMPVLENADLWCEPGRALCAEAGSQIVRVELRKGDALYLNDGSYGSLFDMTHTETAFPVRRIESLDAPRRLLTAFRLFGPTCDSIDAARAPVFLPDDIAEGDYLEFGLTGAYGSVLRTNFNGFGAEREAILTDAPMATMFADAEAADALGNSRV